MAVTAGPRTGVTLWSDPDDPVTQAQFEASHEAIENLLAVDSQQALPLPAASTRGRYLWATDDRGGRLWRDDGAAWSDIGPGPVDGPGSGYHARAAAKPSAAVDDTVLVVRGRTGQTGPLTVWQDPTGAPVATMSAAGQLNLTGANLVMGAGRHIAAEQLWDTATPSRHLVDLRNSGPPRLATLAGAGATAGWTVDHHEPGLVAFRVAADPGQTADLTRWDVGGVTQIAVTAGGRVGIGAPTPAAPLEVLGAPNLTGGTVRVTRANPAADNQSLVMAGGAAVDYLIGRAAGSDDLLFDTAPVPTPSTPTERLRLTAGGDLKLSTGDLQLAEGKAVRYVTGAAGRALYQDATNIYVGAVDAARNLKLRAQAADRVTITAAATTIADAAGADRASITAAGFASLGYGRFGAGALGAAAQPYVDVANVDSIRAGHTSLADANLTLAPKGAGHVYIGGTSPSLYTAGTVHNAFRWHGRANPGADHDYELAYTWFPAVFNSVGEATVTNPIPSSHDAVPDLLPVVAFWAAANPLGGTLARQVTVSSWGYDGGNTMQLSGGPTNVTVNIGLLYLAQMN